MSMVEMKVSELEDVALDWATAGQVHSEKWRHDKYEGGLRASMHGYRPSFDWSQGGPLLERFCIEISIGDEDYFACKVPPTKYDDPARQYAGATMLQAACRAIVATKLGETVSIPSELAGAQS